MQWYRALPVALSLAVLFSAPAFAQDPVKVDAQHYKVILENPSVRVLRISYQAGTKSVMHVHPDSIVVALGPSKVRFTTPDGKFQDMDMASDSALYIPAGTHNPANIGTTPVDAILVEFRAAAPGKAALPTSRPNMTVKSLAEGPRAAAYRVSASPAFAEPAGSTHDFDQIVIALSPLQLSLAIDGKPARTTWARGDAVFIGRGVPHEAKASGVKPGDTIIIAIK